MKQLTSSQRKILSAAASKLNALVIIGQNGLSEGIAKKCAECLENHELVKIKFNEFKDEKKSLTEELCQKTGAALVRIIGNTAILYKESSDEEKRKHLI